MLFAKPQDTLARLEKAILQFVLTLMFIVTGESALPADALSAGDDALCARAMVHAGDLGRIQHQLARARRGENIVVGVIGGSITQGAKASTAGKTYGNLVADWWREKFPKSSVTFVNAGIGATGSDYGALRVQRDLLSRKPDFIIVEYAVNDGNSQASAETLEGLLRQILKQPNQPAVLLLFMMNQQGANAQEWFTKVGDHYHLPMISYRDALWAEIQAGRLTWRDISPDEVHPNDRGHASAARFVTRQLDQAWKNLPTDDALQRIPPLPAPRFTDLFEHTVLIEADALKPMTNSGWSFDAKIHCWKSEQPGSAIEFEIEGQNIFTMHYVVRGPMGRAKVTVDGAAATELEAWFDQTWGGYRQTRQVARALPAGKHRVRFELLPESSKGSTGHEFRIMGLGAAGVVEKRLSSQREPTKTIVIDFTRELGRVEPRTGFLGGLRDTTPDEIIQPLHPSLWRIGHQFRGRIAKGLPGAIDRVEKLGATYKLVMSDLIGDKPKDYSAYESAVKKLVAQVGTNSSRIIWEPVNEPDISHKPITGYYEVYAHAFKALREADPEAQICGPGFAFPSYDKYRGFLDFCRSNHLECNYLAWHYTGWDPASPEKQKWQLGRMREFLTDYPDQKILEIHCDEWGAGPDKPGRLHPGRAVVWFHFLENVYRVDRACRANWGKEDDYLGGIITTTGETLPVYHAYQYYGSTKGQMRVTSEGNDDRIAALGSKTGDRYEILLGSVSKLPTKVTLDLKGLPMSSSKIQVRLVPASNLDVPLTAENIPLMKDFTTERDNGSVRITLGRVEENQAYHILLTP